MADIDTSQPEICKNCIESNYCARKFPDEHVKNNITPFCYVPKPERKVIHKEAPTLKAGDGRGVLNGTH